MSLHSSIADNLFGQTGFEKMVGIYSLKFNKSEIKKIFDRPLEKEIVESQPFQRLKGIHFLGAQDYVFQPSGTSFTQRQSRFDHSLGVGRLAKIYSREIELNSNEENLIVAAALLHDIGHAPLSHSFESAIKNSLGIGHHQLTENIIKGASKRFGTTIPKILNKYDVNPDDVIELINGNYFSSFSHLFSSPINIDTIEGICRANSYRDAHLNYISPDEIIKNLLVFDAKSKKSFDRFWGLKKDIYKVFVQNPINVLSDFIAVFYFQKLILKNPVNKIWKLLEGTDEELKKSSPRMFEFLWVIPRLVEGKESFEKLEKNFEKRVMKEIEEIVFSQITYTQRDFYIEEDQELKSTTDLTKRYKQKKTLKKLDPFQISNEKQELFPCL